MCQFHGNEDPDFPMGYAPVHDRRATTCNHSPNTAVGVKHGKLERCTSAAVEFLNVGLLLCQVTTPWRRPDCESGADEVLNNFVQL